MAGGPGGKEVGRISVRAVPDTSRFRKELLAKLEAIENGLKVEVPIDPDTKGFRAKVKAATSNLPEAKVKVKADVDKSLSSQIKGLFDKIPSVKLGTGINPAGYAVIATALAAVIAPAVGLITTALLAVPGVLAGIAAPIAAITLGLEGMGKAAAPLKSGFDGLKATMNSVNESAFLPVFQKLAGIFPTLKASMPAVSRGLADIAQSMVDVVTSPEGLSKIETIINNIGTSLTKSAPGIGKLVDGVLGLAQTLSQKLPAVSDFINEAGDSFVNWVREITTIGPTGKSPLTTAFEGLGGTLRTVLSLVGKLGEKGIEFMNDPEKVAKMAEAFDQIADAMGRIVDASSGFFSVMDKIEDSHQNRALEDEGTGALLREGFDPKNLFGPDTTGPFFQGMVDNIKAKFALLPPFFTNLWATIQANAQSQFGAIWNGLADGATGQFNLLVANAATCVQQIVSQFGQVPGALAATWGGLAGAASGAWSAVVNVVANALATIVGQVVSVGGQIVAEVASWGGKVAAAAQSIAGALVGIGPQMIAGFLGGFRSAAAGAIAEVASWAGRIAAAARDALSIGSPSKVFHEIGANTVQGFNNGFDENSQSAIDKAKSLAESITEAMNTGLSGVDTEALTGQVRDSLAALELERKGLKVQANEADAAGNKDLKKSLQDRMKEIQVIKDQLGLQKDQLGLNTKQSDELGKQDDTLGSTLNKMMEIGSGFAMANVKQFQSDIGIQGGGALTSLADIGLGWGTQMMGKLISGGMGGGTTINVNSIDDALAAKQNLANKKALQYTQRGSGK